ncbi:hypothetical protein [Sphingomonas sp.]|uniref:hypothetical protein n=1 Tax=Sphingomonas sp. TaxID=28214 RepID=UPI003CC5638E
MTATYAIPILTEAQYTILTNAAKARGLKFMMQIGVYNAPSAELPWSVAPTNTAYWDAWFAAYRPLVLQQTTIATKPGIDLHIAWPERWLYGFGRHSLLARLNSRHSRGRI